MIHGLRYATFKSPGAVARVDARSILSSEDEMILLQLFVHVHGTILVSILLSILLTILPICFRD